MAPSTEIRPLGDRAIVRPIESESMTTSGLHIPDMAKEKQQQGDVLAVGEGRYSEAGVLVPMRLKKGDRVLFGRYSGTEITVDGAKVLIVKESDVLAVVVAK